MLREMVSFSSSPLTPGKKKSSRQRRQSGGDFFFWSKGVRQDDTCWQVQQIVDSDCCANQQIISVCLPRRENCESRYFKDRSRLLFVILYGEGRERGEGRWKPHGTRSSTSMQSLLHGSHSARDLCNYCLDWHLRRSPHWYPGGH